MKIFKSIETWLLYWGSKDERVRVGADKAGHVAFQVALGAILGLIFYLLYGGRLEDKSLIGVLVLIASGPVAVYYVLWALNGVTVLESRVQKLALKWLLFFSPLGTGLLYWFLFPGRTEEKIWWVGGSALLVALISWGGISFVNIFAKRNAGSTED